MESNQALHERIGLIKLKRIEVLNEKLIESLSQDRISASNASYLILKHIEDTPDYLIPCLYKLPIQDNKWLQYQNQQKLIKKSQGCCVIV
jgi:guanine nucleotide-binding protein subunit gamma